MSKTTWGYVLPAFVGIWLGFSAKYLKQILANFALFIHIRAYKRLSDPLGGPVESTPLLEGNVTPTEITKRVQVRKSAKVLSKVYKNGEGVREFVEELCFNRELSQRHRCFLSLFLFIISSVMIAFIITGVYVARIRADGPALLAAEKCGLWVFDRERGGDEAATRAGINDLDKETRAGAYAANCYGESDPFEAIQCNYLYQSRISFSPPQYTTDCPFENEICGQNQTVTFTTDTVDASELGINSQTSPKFRRRTSCVPLSMEYPYIQNQTQNGTTSYYYYYGEKPLHNPPLKYTYTTTGDPFDRLAPAYDVLSVQRIMFAYCQHANESSSTYTTSSTTMVESYWKPRPELTHPKFSTLTLIFVSSLRIFYKKWSNDPIFPADKEVFLPDERKPWFRNSDPRARPLACINYIEVCLGDGKTCWPMNDHLPKNASNEAISPPPEFWLMYASLLKTDIYNAIEKRLGRSLIAQSKVSQYFSEALGDRHWVDEVQQLVATMHARTQINTWSIAKGEDSKHEGADGYTLITPRDKYGNLCGMFKYNPPGYASIRFTPLICILLSFPPFLVLSRKWPWSYGVQAEQEESEHSHAQYSLQDPVSPAAALSGTGERASAVAGPSGSPSGAVPRNSEQEGPQLPDPAVIQAAHTRAMPKVTSTEEAHEVEWEPLVIEKIIEWGFGIAQLGWLLLIFLFWKWPLKYYESLSQTNFAIGLKGFLVSLLQDWPSRAFERLSKWWRDRTSGGVADEVVPE